MERFEDVLLKVEEAKLLVKRKDFESEETDRVSLFVLKEDARVLVDDFLGDMRKIRSSRQQRIRESP